LGCFKILQAVPKSASAKTATGAAANENGGDAAWSLLVGEAGALSVRTTAVTEDPPGFTTAGLEPSLALSLINPTSAETVDSIKLSLNKGYHYSDPIINPNHPPTCRGELRV
jgi:hypothetical protein